MISKPFRATLTCGIASVMALVGGRAAPAEPTVDFAGATVVIRIGQLPKAEQTAAQVLVEELEKRIGKRLPVSTAWPKDGIVVALTSSPADTTGGHAVPKPGAGDRPEARREGYR